MFKLSAQDVTPQRYWHNLYLILSTALEVGMANKNEEMMVAAFDGKLNTISSIYGQLLSDTSERALELKSELSAVDFNEYSADVAQQYAELSKQGCLYAEMVTFIDDVQRLQAPVVGITTLEHVMERLFSDQSPAAARDASSEE